MVALLDKTIHLLVPVVQAVVEHHLLLAWHFTLLKHFVQFSIFLIVFLNLVYLLILVLLFGLALRVVRLLLDLILLHLDLTVGIVVMLDAALIIRRHLERGLLGHLIGGAAL